MGELEQLYNIGTVIEKQLNAVGIYTKNDLESIGSQEAWLRIQSIDSSACINRLLSLEGAIQGIPKKELSEIDKKWLRDFYRNKKINVK